jgi:predicted AAA+ superfamily ATPase
LTIWPLSQGELAGVHEDLLPALAADPAAAVARHPQSATTREEYVERICAGGFPLALARPAPQRARWFADYLRQCLERDALELSRLRQRQALAELLTRVAGQTARVLNVTAVADGLSITRRTAEEYVRLLEDLFLVSRLPAWGRTLRSRARAQPKVHVVDSGVAAHLMGLSERRLAAWDPTVQTEFGHLLETFVVGELRKQVSWLEEPVTVGHWRTGDGAEVDFVVEFLGGSVIAFEVKSSRSANPKDFNGLRSLRAVLGEAFKAGVLLNSGGHSYAHDDRLYVMPIDRLWRPDVAGDLAHSMSLHIV